MLREIQRLSQEEGINLNGIKRILDLERELQQTRLLAAQLHSDGAQLRAELESTRAVAARLAHLRRAPADPAAALVPVRTTTTHVAFLRAAAQETGPVEEAAAPETS
jgi:MerR family transcriptional regulator/heat shock protein HspR